MLNNTFTLAHASTNESLEAVIAGMNVRPEDRILSIGGSGDQAFAFLEKGAGVVVVDNNPKQVDLIRQKAKLLRNENYNGFLRAGLSEAYLANPTDESHMARNRYLRKRLPAIRERLDKLDILGEEDIFRAVSALNGYNKVYLSTVFGQMDISDNYKIRERLALVAENLSAGSLVYVGDHNVIVDYLIIFSDLQNGFKKLVSPFIIISWEKRLGLSHPGLRRLYAKLFPSSLAIDESLTQVARIFEKEWYPAVYRKI